MATVIEDAIIERMRRILGYVPIGTRDLLHILVGPDMITLTESYVAEKRSQDQQGV